MRLPYFVADAFAAGPFTGNPAAVVPLDAWVPDALMQAIAEQHNLAETAFVVVHPDEQGARALRWFTPAREVRLCGHATLATAFALCDVLKFPGAEFAFATLSGKLTCAREAPGRYRMTFPADEPRPAGNLAAALRRIAGDEHLAADRMAQGTDDALIAFGSAREVLDFEVPDSLVRALPKRGLIVTAPGEHGYDVYSRCFYPEFGVDEDAATGSAHTLLGVYWSRRLGKSRLRCRQASRRGGDIDVHYAGAGEISLTGRVRLYAHGELETGDGAA